MASQDGLTSGQSVTTTWSDINGNKNWQILESFTAKEDADVPKQTAIDGKTRHPLFLRGWSGTAVYQRGSNSLDQYFADRERNYYNGADQVDLTITQTIKEVNGKISQYQFIGVTITMEDAGTVSGTDIVKQTISWQAKRRMALQ